MCQLRRLELFSILIAEWPVSKWTRDRQSQSSLGLGQTGRLPAVIVATIMFTSQLQLSLDL